MKIKDLINLGDEKFSVDEFKELHALISANVPENVYVSMHSHIAQPRPGETKKRRLYRVSFTYGEKKVGFMIRAIGELAIYSDETLKDSPFMARLLRHLES